MKPYRPRYTADVADRIRKLHPDIKRDIRQSIRDLLGAPLAGCPLQFELFGYRTYRIIYQLNDDEATLDVIYVGPRRTVYDELRALLLEKQRED